MNVKRFTARTSREALPLVREALGDDAVVLSTKPCGRGRRGAGDGAREPGDVEQVRASAPMAAACRAAPRRPPTCEQDVEQLSMSTLSFQDYVRERMLKRRQAAIAQPASAARPAPAAPAA